MFSGFDLGQYFNATGLDFDTDAPYLYYMDKFENSAVRKEFCKAYIDEAYRLKALNLDYFPTDLVSGNRQEDNDKLMEESYCFLACASLFFGCWAICYAHHGLRLNQDDQEGFNYGAYGRDRLALYFHQKSHIKKFLENLNSQ